MTGQEGDYQVKLERGSVRTRFEEGTRFEVQAKDARVRPVENPSTSATEASVTITSTGKLHVRSYAGTFEIVDRNGDRQGTIPPGASAVIGVSQTTGLQLAGGAGSAAGGISTMEVLLYGGGAAAVVGGGVAAGVLLSDDDDDGSPSGP